MYNKTVMDRFKNPRNAGGMHGANAIGQVGDNADIMRMYLKISDDGVIENARFKTFGCCAAIASTDVACDIVKGLTIDEAIKINNQEIIERLGELPPHKIHCTIMAQESVRAAIDDFYERKEKEIKKAKKKSKKQNELDGQEKSEN